MGFFYPTYNPNDKVQIAGEQISPKSDQIVLETKCQAMLAYCVTSFQVDELWKVLDDYKLETTRMIEDCKPQTPVAWAVLDWS